MDKLPNELLDRICSFLERHDLRTVIQLSSSFRRLAMLPYLECFGISQANIQSGTLSISRSFFLIIIVAGIRPIQRLVCYDQVSGPVGRYRGLAKILSATAPIPDIVIYNRYYMFQRTKRETAFVLSRIPWVATTPLLIVKASSMHLSHPRSSPPIRWKLLPPPFGSLGLSTSMNFLVVMFGIPLLFAYLVSGVVNLAVLCMWVYRRVSKPPWSQEERIIEDTGLLLFDSWMRIQPLPHKHLTLVTLTDHRWHGLTLGPVPGLSDSAYSAVLAALDLGTHLQELVVYRKANLVHSELLGLVKRHPHLTSLQFESDSIRPASLTQIPVVADPENKIKVLNAPSPYIPYLLPVAPNVHNISLLFSPAAHRLPPLRSSIFGLPAYHSALEAIALLPGTHPLTLSLFFRFPAASLPWAGLPDAEAIDCTAFPEARLARVTTLQLCRDGPGLFCAADIRDAVRWLALFPGLQRLMFAYGAVEQIPVPERVALAELICAACKDIGRPQDIAFNIYKS